MLDQGIHLLDLLRFFNGDFHEYKSFISNKFWNYDVEDNAFALMRDKNGVIASIHSTATQWRHKFRIEITTKQALIELKGILSGTKSYGKESLRIIERLPRSSNGSRVKKQYFFDGQDATASQIVLEKCKTDDNIVFVLAEIGNCNLMSVFLSLNIPQVLLFPQKSFWTHLFTW